MATRQDEINARKELLRLQEEELLLAERKANIEEQLSREGDKRLKNAKDLKDELERTDQSINRNLDQQFRQEKEINRQKDERLKKEKVLLGLDKKIIKEAKENRNIEKSLLKSLDKGIGKIIEQTLQSKELVKTRKIENDKIVETLANKDKLKKLDAGEIESLETKLEANNALGNLEKEILSDVESQNFKHMDQQDILNRLEQQGIDLSKLDAEAKKRIMIDIDRIVKGTESFTEEFQKGVGVVEEIDNLFDDLVEKSEKYGAVLKDPNLRMKAFQGLILGAAASLAKDLFNAAVEVRQELGVGVGEAAALGVKITAAEKVTKVLGGRAGEVQNFATGIAREFGNVEQLSTGVALQFAKISATTGITGDAAAKLAKSIQIIQGGSLETSLNMIEVFEATARTAGVMPKLVLEDIANSTETFAKFAKDGGKNIAAAAAQAAKLGLNLDTVAGIAESLLDFESSIEKQLEAQVLLGRSLNLDKARELSLAGDLEGLQKEIVKQVGSQAEFEAMNVVERKALADAIGTSVADLGKMVAGEKTSAQLAKEQAEAQHASILNQEKIMEIMKVMAGIQMAILGTESLINIAKAFGVTLGKKQAASAGLEAGANVAGAAAEAGQSAAKVPFIGPLLAAAAMLTIGGLGFKLLTQGKSKGEGFAEGGVVGKDGSAVPAQSDTVPAMLTPGEVVLNAGQQRNVASAIQATGATDMSGVESKMDAQVKESKEMNQNTKKLLEQNQFLMNKLIKSNQNLALSNN